MLDLFLEHSYQTTKVAEGQARYLAALEQLPVEELMAMTRGESPLNKLSHDSESCWLEQFAGTPLYDKAIALERHNLELDMAQTADSAERSQQRAGIDTERDTLRVQRRMLELELAEAKLQSAGGAEPQMEAPAGAPPAVAADPNGPPAPEGAQQAKAAADVAAQITQRYPGLVKDKVKKAEFEGIDEKIAAMRFQLALEKRALGIPGVGGAMLQGLKGMGGFLAGTGRNVAQAAGAGGLGAVGQTLGGAARMGGQMATNFTRANPAAALGLMGAGAAGAGYLAGNRR
jgi:hypothetical protein